METSSKNESTKTNKESTHQTNATIEPAVSIRLLFTKQRTPLSRTTKASQSQILSTLLASTPKLHFVSSTSMEVMKSSPTASHVPFTTLQQESKLSTVSLYTPTNEIIQNSVPIIVYSSRTRSSNKAYSSLLKIENPTTSIKDEFIKLIRATTTHYSSTKKVISTSHSVITPSKSKATEIANELLPETSSENSRKEGFANTIKNISVTIPLTFRVTRLISTLLATASQTIPVKDKITLGFIETFPFKDQTINTEENIYKTSYSQESVTSPVALSTDKFNNNITYYLLPVTASTITVLPVTSSTNSKPDGIKNASLLSETTDMIENITSALTITPSTTATSQSLNQSLETTLTTTSRAISESNSETYSMPNKIIPSSQQAATFTDDFFTSTHPFVMSTTLKKKISTTRLPVTTVGNETITTKLAVTQPTLLISDYITKETTSTLLPVSPDNNKSITTDAQIALSATIITHERENAITTLLAKITVSSKTTVLPTISITEGMATKFTATSSPIITSTNKSISTNIPVTSPSNSNKEEIRKEMNVSAVPVKTNTDSAITKVSHVPATQTLSRSKTHTEVLPVTPLKILDKEEITNVMRTTSLPLTTVGNNSKLPVTLAMSSTTDRVTNEITVTSSQASMDSSAKISISASSTSDRITVKLTSTLLPSIFPTSSSKTKSTEFITLQPKSSTIDITNEINSASQPDKTQNLLQTHGISTTLSSATSPKLSDTDEFKTSLTYVNLTLSPNAGGGTVTVNPCIYITMLCYALLCGFNDMTVV